jgi:hypothetical protein
MVIMRAEAGPKFRKADETIDTEMLLWSESGQWGRREKNLDKKLMAVLTPRDWRTEK